MSDYLLFIGVVVAMVIYNAFLYYTSRDKIYLFYTLYLISILIAVPFNKGYPIFNWDWMWNYYGVWHAIPPVLASLFAIYYLKLKTYSPLLYKILWVLNGVFLLVFPIATLVEVVSVVQFNTPFQITILLHAAVMLIGGIYVWVKGYKPARFYVIGWSFMILSNFIFIFTINGFLPLNLFTFNVTYIGFALEALLFALALGDRMNILQKEYNEAQAKNLTLIQNQKEQLEKQVLERTKELHTSNIEIMAQNEEILSLNESLETIVSERGMKLQVQNQKLKDFAHFHSHNLRTPLARTLAVINWIHSEQIDSESPLIPFIDMISQSAEEIDAVIKEMHNMLEEANFYEDQK